jgi:hypothetical protein
VPNVFRNLEHEIMTLVAKFDLAAMLIAVVGGALWIEHGNRTRIAVLTDVQLAEPASVSPCLDDDNVPYSPQCIAFMEGQDEASSHRLPSGTASEASASHFSPGPPAQPVAPERGLNRPIWGGSFPEP